MDLMALKPSSELCSYHVLAMTPSFQKLWTYGNKFGLVRQGQLIENLETSNVVFDRLERLALTVGRRHLSVA